MWRNQTTYLDSEGADDCDHVEASTYDTILREGWVIIPNGLLVLDDTDLGDLAHEVFDAELRDVCHAPVGDVSQCGRAARACGYATHPSLRSAAFQSVTPHLCSCASTSCAVVSLLEALSAVTWPS